MSVTMSVMDLVMAARSEVVLSSPYFVPGTMGVQAFGDLRKRDVKVTILTNSLASNDEPLVHTGYARYRRELLRTGVDLYELSPTRIQRNKRLGLPGASLGRLHAKTAVIDRHDRVHRLDEPRPALGQQEHRARHHRREPGAREGSAARHPHQQAAERLPPAVRRRRPEPRVADDGRRRRGRADRRARHDAVPAPAELLLAPFVPEQQL